MRDNQWAEFRDPKDEIGKKYDLYDQKEELLKHNRRMEASYKNGRHRGQFNWLFYQIAENSKKMSKIDTELKKYV